MDDQYFAFHYVELSTKCTERIQLRFNIVAQLVNFKFKPKDYYSLKNFGPIAQSSITECLIYLGFNHDLSHN